jgi:hypothetical protein
MVLAGMKISTLVGTEHSAATSGASPSRAIWTREIAGASSVSGARPVAPPRASECPPPRPRAPSLRTSAGPVSLARPGRPDASASRRGRPGDRPHAPRPPPAARRPPPAGGRRTVARQRPPAARARAARSSRARSRRPRNPPHDDCARPLRNHPRPATPPPACGTPTRPTSIPAEVPGAVTIAARVMRADVGATIAATLVDGDGPARPPFPSIGTSERAAPRREVTVEAV